MISGNQTVLNIELSGQPFQEIGKHLSRFFPYLVSLSLRKNKIKSISPNAFVGLHNLVTLDLEDNIINIIPAGELDHLVAIRNILIKRNPIKWHKSFTYDNFFIINLDRVMFQV